MSETNAHIAHTNGPLLRSAQRPRRLQFALICTILSGAHAIAGASFPCGAQPHSRTPHNFFSDDQSKTQPGFGGPRLSDSDKENRLIPDIRLLRTLPGLDPETRKKINSLYKTWQDSTADLRNQLQSTQRQIAKSNEDAALRPNKAGMVDKLAADADKSPKSSDSSVTLSRDSKDMAPEICDSQNLPSSTAKLESDLPEKSLASLRKEQKQIRDEMQTKRKELWDSIKPLLSEQNLSDLDKMRRGEYMPVSSKTTEEKSK